MSDASVIQCYNHRIDLIVLGNFENTIIIDRREHPKITVTVNWLWRPAVASSIEWPAEVGWSGVANDCEAQVPAGCTFSEKGLDITVDEANNQNRETIKRAQSGLYIDHQFEFALIKEERGV
jgi:hypothetical protein